jgi:hypothetical protein
MRRIVTLLMGCWLMASVPALPAATIDPGSVSLEQLAAIRGAMWTARHPMRAGPRPGQPSNILALTAIAGEPPDGRAAAFKAYTGRGYTHGVIGAWQPEGFSPYHDVYPKQRPTFDQYLDLLQEFWDHGVMPVVFIKPDGWSCAQLESLTPFYQQPRAQKLVRIEVPGGWEPNKATTPAEWECWMKWGRRVLPNALNLVHMEADPSGMIDVWKTIAPSVHGYLVQNAGYVHGGSEQPSAEFIKNFTEQFRLNPKPGKGSLLDRFTWGYAGWPTSSAWGEGKRIRVYAAEYAAYGNFWWDWDEKYARQLGDAAMAAGADGYLDGGTVTVPVRKP